jgi:3-hydroxybutyryl-CoA dehydrogenase
MWTRGWKLDIENGGAPMNRTFEKVAVIGAGTLGAQIALLAANSSYDVTVYDVREGALWETVERLIPSIEAKGIHPIIPWEQACSLKGRIREVTDLEEALQGAELVMESVPENLEVKRNVFKELGRKAPPGAIIATNSSSIPVSRMEDSSGRPERCLNIHFYSILEGMNMADVMGGTRTTKDALEKGIAWVRSMGCIPLTVKRELLGFCFNRVWRAIKREGLWMWGNDYVDFRDIDRAWMTFSHMKMGPFGLMDGVGLDVVYAIEMVYFTESKDPKDKPPQALKEKIDRGELGVKSGKGFYAYPDPEFARGDFLNPTPQCSSA